MGSPEIYEAHFTIHKTPPRSAGWHTLLRRGAVLVSVVIPGRGSVAPGISELHYLMVESGHDPDSPITEQDSPAALVLRLEHLVSVEWGRLSIFHQQFFFDGRFVVGDDVLFFLC